MKPHQLLLGFFVLTGFTDLPQAVAQTVPQSQPPAPLTQTVRLADGSIYQGELVELVPGDHLTIRLATGETRRFAWTEILPPEIPAPVAGTPAGATSVWLSKTVNVVLPQPPPPPNPAELTQLHFQASDPEAVLLTTRSEGGVHFNHPGINYDFQDWRMLCPRSPCDVSADRRQIYRVQGPSIIPSLPFTLPQEGAASAYANVAHQGTRTFFNVVTALGVGGLLSGLGLVIAGAAQDTDSSIQPMKLQQDAVNRQKTYYTAGGALLGGGALFMITGIIAAAYTRTTLRFGSDGRLALRLPGKVQLDLASQQVRF